MNFKDFYKEVSKDSGYDEELIRVVWNHFWKSLKESTTITAIIDIDNFGLFHASPQKLYNYVNLYPTVKEEIKILYDFMMKENRLTKYLRNGTNNGSIDTRNDTEKE